MSNPLRLASAPALRNAAVCALLGLAAMAAHAGPGPYNTGVDNNGVPLASNAIDPHYGIVNSPVFGPAAFIKHESDGPPINPGGWLPDNTLSSWLVPSTDFFFGDVPGVTDNITYRTTFDLTGYSLVGGSISGKWAADDTGLAIRVNGMVVPGFGVAQNNQWALFSIDGGFVPGLNVLEFDTRSTVNPTGLRVEMNSIFAPVPEPATWLMCLAGIAGLLQARRKAGAL